jgi:hypothetical protein
MFGTPLTDKEALDQINYLLSADEWPGASGMEDIAEIVARTGREYVENTEGWESH